MLHHFGVDDNNIRLLVDMLYNDMVVDFAIREWSIVSKACSKSYAYEN